MAAGDNALLRFGRRHVAATSTVAPAKAEQQAESRIERAMRLKEEAASGSKSSGIDGFADDPTPYSFTRAILESGARKAKAVFEFLAFRS